MKVRNSLRSLKNRHRDCRVVRRKRSAGSKPARVKNCSHTVRKGRSLGGGFFVCGQNVSQEVIDGLDHHQ
jgi:hypothetical protein